MRTSSLVAAGTLAAVVLSGCGGSGVVKGADALVFVSTRDGTYELYASSADGSHQHRLTGDRGDASTPTGLQYQLDPAWSPDGSRIAFSSSRDGQTHLFVVDAAGKKTTRLALGGEDRHPTWSPDGKHLVFTRASPGRIEIINADGSGAHRLTPGTAEEGDPAWSPDGRWIAYDRRTPGGPIRELWLIHPDGSGNHQLTALQASTTAPTWSPDSKRIAFSSNARGGHFAIYSIGASGIGLRLVSASQTDEIQPAWSPDGKLIAFSKDGAIVVAPSGAGGEKALTDPKDNDSSPAWKPLARIHY